MQKRSAAINPEITLSSQVACIGLGFVGYHSAIAFCESDHTVVGVDTDEKLIESIQNGTQPFETDELKPYIDQGVCRTTREISDTEGCDVYVVSVPTPVREDNVPDLSYLRTVCRSVAPVLEEGNLVVIQSTVYPGCIRDELIPELERSGLDAGTDFGVSHVPERYSPGDAESKTTPRIVGSIDDHWCDITGELYQGVATSTVQVSSLEVAETIKLVENIQRDVNIAIINELATALDQFGIDIWEVIDGADTKWNFHRYEPRLGVGGHCLPIDPYYFRTAAEQCDEELELILAAREINRSMPEYYCDQILRTLRSRDKSVLSATVAVLGVTYKSGVKDIRNSPALELIRHLRGENVSTTVFDPKFETNEPIDGTTIVNETNAAAAVQDADVAVIAAGHDEFKALDPADLERMMGEESILLDLQRALDSDAVENGELVRLRDACPTESTAEFEVTAGIHLAERGIQEDDDD